MRKLILRIALTLDDVAALDDAADVMDHSDEDVWRDIFRTLETVDGLLLGGTMAEEYLGYWHGVLANPDASANERRFAGIAERTQHYVLSRTPRELKWPNATVLAGGVDGIPGLKRQEGGDLLLWGGPTVAAAAIEAGVVDEYHLVTHPVVAGRGKKLFDRVARLHPVRHLDTATFPSGIVTVKYARA